MTNKISASIQRLVKFTNASGLKKMKKLKATAISADSLIKQRAPDQNQESLELTRGGSMSILKGIERGKEKGVFVVATLVVKWRSILVPLISSALIGTAFAASTASTPSFDRFLVQAPSHSAGQSATLLPNGRWLLVGGTASGSVSGTIQIEDLTDAAHPSVQNALKNLAVPRAGHTATVLPDGTVLILGGTGADGSVVSVAELFDPQAQTLITLPGTGLIPRSRHTATLLTDGRVLVSGGLSQQGLPVQQSELWSSRTFKAEMTVAAMETARSDHQAALLSNGQGLMWGGNDISGKPLENGELFDPSKISFSNVNWWDTSALPAKELSLIVPQLADSLPVSGAKDVPVDAQIAVRFSEPLQMQTINGGSITLVGPGGAVNGKVIGAESGLLAFFTPKTDLSPDTTYTLFLNGLADGMGRSLPFSSFSFSTHRFSAGATSSSHGYIDVKITPPKPKVAVSNKSTTTSAANPVASKAKPDNRKKDDPEDDDKEDWIPKDANRHGNWRVLGLADDPVLESSGARQADFVAESGLTAVSGHVVRLNGRPLAGVNVSIGGQATVTDASGRFLIAGLTSGAQQLKIDGTTVRSRGRHYTQHFIEVNLEQGKTTSLPDSIYLPRVNPAMEFSISSPADKELVLTHPDIPGLEVHIPKGAVLRQYDGKVVTKLSITPVPVDRAPYPTPADFTVYFTLQPGGAFVDGDPNMAVKIIYPNYEKLPAGSPVDFWNYDPNGGGWKVYGHGEISADGTKVVPDGNVGFRQIMTFGFAFSQSKVPPAKSPVDCGVCTADPVDLATGIFTHNVTDMALPDVMPIAINRSYRPSDTNIYPFGMGTNLSYGMYLYSVNQDPSPNIDLIMADGSRVAFPRTAQSVSSHEYNYNGHWANIGSPGEFNGAVLTTQPNLTYFTLTRRDGTVFYFSRTAPYQLYKIIDRNGNFVSLTLSGSNNSGNVTKITAPNGRMIQLAYGATNCATCIATATDNIGRSVSYSYDTSKRLISVTDMVGNTEQYGYTDPADLTRMTTITDKRGNLATANVYDSSGRVTKQTLADGTFWQFGYVNGANPNIATQTTVTDPRGYVSQYSFNASGYVTQKVLALGQSVQQTYSYTLGANNLPSSITDSLGRQTTYIYNAFGQATSFTQLVGTASPVTSSFIYDTTYHQLTSYTDPLLNPTQWGYTAGKLTSITDALNHSITIGNNAQGLPTSVTDALTHSVQIGYLQADVASVTDALSRKTNMVTDGAGRTVSVTDPLGNRTKYSYDAMNRVLQTINALQQTTTYNYDANSNLTSVIDPRNVVAHQFAYDTRDRVQTKTDPLGNYESYIYDGLGNLTQYTDRKGQVTHYSYDPLNRLSSITYSDGSTVVMTWDAGNRPTQAVDSINGTISWQYDLLDRMTQELTPQGQVNYAYDAAGRRTSMTVMGSAAVSYSYDAANRLTSIAQGSSPSVSYGYDVANRLASLTLPNGVVGTYTYDVADELTNLSYAMGAVSVGALAYTYDNAGRRSSRVSTLDQTGGPAVVGTASDARVFGWNARNQLASISGGATASFSYDMMGRRSGKTVSGTNRSFVYDGQNLVQELNGGAAFASYLTGLGVDQAYSRTDSSSTQSYLTDALGSVVSLASSSGTVATSYKYDAYGNTTATGTASQSSLQYAGRENDGAGLYYNRGRYYSPQFGRFISNDPIGLAGGINTYAYVGGNPISFTDPMGRAQFGKRALDALGFIPYMGTNPGDDERNMEWVHETVWFDDAAQNPNLPASAGFFGDKGMWNEPGTVRSDAGHQRSEYAMEPGIYDDALMRKALANLTRWNSSRYNVADRNCQDFADALKAEYFSLGGKVTR